jgi:hypothetical protein
MGRECIAKGVCYVDPDNRFCFVYIFSDCIVTSPILYHNIIKPATKTGLHNSKRQMQLTDLLNSLDDIVQTILRRQ